MFAMSTLEKLRIQWPQQKWVRCRGDLYHHLTPRREAEVRSTSLPVKQAQRRTGFLGAPAVLGKEKRNQTNARAAIVHLSFGISDIAFRYGDATGSV